MAILVPAPRSISFLGLSVGSIILSILIAPLLVSYGPTGFNFTINGYFIGIGHSKQPSLNSINGNRTKVLIRSPEISEQGQDAVKNDQLSSVAEVPAFAPTLSVVDEIPPTLFADDLQEVESANNSVFANDYDKEPDELLLSVSIDESMKNSSGTVGDSVTFVNRTASVASKDYENSKSGYVAEVPVFAPILSVDDEMPPRMQEVEKINNPIAVNGHDSKEPDVLPSSVYVDNSGGNSSGIGGDGVASLSQTVIVAALPPPPPEDHEMSKLRSCDLYHGKWIYDPSGPLYTNNTCPILAQPQNCQGNGRPDKNYENWRWKPNQCGIPRFDGRKFLELMRGKTLAFVGDSLARNQMESLLCILWQTEVPINHGNRQMHKWYFQSTSTTIARIWSAWLVHKTPLPVPSASPRAVKVHLDTPDNAFIQFLPKFDVVVLSSGHWFTTESTYLLNGTTARRQLRRAKRSPKSKSPKFNNVKFYGIAVQTVLNAIGSVPNYSGLTILRSYSPEHYEGGAWNTGGTCAGVDRPATKTVRSGYATAMWKQQVAEFERAVKKLRNGSKLKFMDITEMSGYRHDGHAGPYRSNVRKKGGPEDCVHWCMPGTADTWNEVLFEIFKRELRISL